MGKKSAQKKHKQHQGGSSQNQPVRQAATTPRPGLNLASLSGELGTPVTMPQPKNQIPALENSVYVRQDIIRILTLLIGVLVLLVVAVAINGHTSLLAKAGSKVASFMQL